MQDDTSLKLKQVLNFIQNADSLMTCTFYKDLANIPNATEISQLPDGICSARLCKGRKRLFVLFRHNTRQIHAGLFDAQGKLFKDGDRREVAMQAIRCEVNEPKAPASYYPDDDDFDIWIENARQHWANFQGIPDHRLPIVCAMALIPEQ